MDTLYTGALFQPELRLTVGTADVTVGFEIAYLHKLPLEEIRHGGIDADKAVILIQTLCDIFRQRAEYRKRAHKQYHNHHDRAADKEVDDIQQSRDNPDKCIQFIVSVAPLHKLSGFFYQITHNITVAFSDYQMKYIFLSVEIATAPKTRFHRLSKGFAMTVIHSQSTFILTHDAGFFKKIIPLSY